MKRRRKDALGDEAHYDLVDPDRGVMLEIPDGTTEISHGAFADCGGVAILTIPASVTRIGRNAFQGCSSLTNLTILESVHEIVSRISCTDSGMGVRWLQLVGEPDHSRVCDRYTDDFAFSSCRSLTSLILAESVTRIGADRYRGRDVSVLSPTDHRDTS